MRGVDHITFGDSGLDRAEDFRRDPRALRDLRSKARIFPVWRGKPLLTADRTALAYVSADSTLPMGLEVFLGRENETAFFAWDVSDLDVRDADNKELGSFFDKSEQTHPDLPAGSAFVDLKRAMAALSPRDGELAAMARSVLDWHRTHGFCANCGAPTTPAKAGFQRVCPACGFQHFPRTDPVVIMLVTYGNDVLLGRNTNWPKGMYSLLAGFIDPSETLEAAVRREVWEEAGVRVGSVRYLASQPWPFPSSLMLGCWGEALGREIAIDPEEIEDARWVSREQMCDALTGHDPELLPARKGAIARFLLENWLADRLDL